MKDFSGEEANRLITDLGIARTMCQDAEVSKLLTAILGSLHNKEEEYQRQSSQEQLTDYVLKKVITG